MPRSWQIVIYFLIAVSLLFLSSMVGIQPRLANPVGAQELTREMRNWEMINHNALGTSYNPQTLINRDNVDQLEVKWIYPYPPASSPGIVGANTVAGSGAPAIVVDGIVYSATNQRALVALDGGDGSTIWISVAPYDNEAIQAAYPHVKGVLPHTHALDYYADRGILIPSFQSCQIDGHDSLLGDITFQLLEICGTQEEAREWGNQGFYASIGTHPPQFFEDIMIVPVMGSSGNGGRSFIAGYDVSDMDNPIRIWQTFLMPGSRGDEEWALHECDKGWFFSFPEWLDTGRKGVPCSEVEEDCRECLLDDWRDPRLGKVHTASTIATIWGHYLVDPETGIVYIGTGESGPYPTAERRPGPNLYGSSIVALDARTGEFVWWYQTVPHDMWDYDCSWNAMLGDVNGRKALFKACKNGFLYALDAATGEPIWVFQPPSLWLPQPGNAYPDPKSLEDLTRKWPTSHVGDDTTFLAANYAGAIETDLAYDGERIYVGSYNMPVFVTAGPIRSFGNQLTQIPTQNPINATIYAVDSDTGEIVWRFDVDRIGQRGGLTVSGGVLYYPAGDGNLYMLDSETGEVLARKFLGQALWTQVSIGADALGQMKIFVQTGGMTITSWGPTGIAGAMIALGLPDEVRVSPGNGAALEALEEALGRAEEAEARAGALEERANALESRVAQLEAQDGIVLPPSQVARGIGPLTYVVIGLGVVLVIFSSVVLNRTRRS